MKIVKEGKLPVLIGKCRVCSCEVEVPYNQEWVSWFTNGHNSYPHFNCPTKDCGARIELYKQSGAY